MYARIDNFAIDKAVKVIVEEGIAPAFIERYYALRGERIRASYNLENGLTGRREFDLIDTLGTKWETNFDRKWHATGNVYVEKQALERSRVDKYLYLAGVGYVAPNTALRLPHRPVSAAASVDERTSSHTEAGGAAPMGR